MTQVRRIYVEKKPGFDVEAQSLLQDLKENVGLAELKQLRLLNRYDVAGTGRGRICAGSDDGFCRAAGGSGF